MDHHNYDTPPLLTNSDYETLMEDLKPDTNFSDIGSPFRLSQIDQNMSDEDPLLKQELQHPPPPLLEQFGPVAVQVRRESESILVTSTTPPELSPSLSPTGTIPSRDDYPGQLEFEIQLDSTTSSKRSWLYSTTLKKVFIDMRKSLLIHFRVNNYLNGLFVRALPVYEQDNFVSVPVQRCGIHQIGDDPHFKAHPPSEPGVCYCARHFMVKHVVQSTHPQARYDYNSESDRHSVVIPLQLPHPGSDTTTVEYQFACKTSCPHGMNRKPIVVIFTLENEACEVLGRQILPVKICSCPKRDKEKEEKEREEREKNAILNGVELPKPGKRRLSSHEKQEAKRIKTENTRQHEAMGTGNQTQEEGSRTDSFEKRILEQFVAMEGRIGQTVANLQGAMEGRIGQTIANLQGAMEGRIAAMEGRIAAMEGRITAMEGRIGQTVANFQAKVDQLLGLVHPNLN